MDKPEVLSMKKLEELHPWLPDPHDECDGCLLATCKKQLDSDIAFYEKEIPQLIETAVNNALLKQYETFETEIPAHIQSAVKDALDKVGKSWSAINYLSPEVGDEPVNSIRVSDWQALRQELIAEK